MITPNYLGSKISLTTHSPQSGTATRFMQPIVNVSRAVAGYDYGQCHMLCGYQNDTDYILYYLGAGVGDEAPDKTFMATLPLSDTVTSGWSKRLDGGNPEVILDLGGVGDFDAKQIWLRSILKVGDNLEGYYIGQSATDVFKVGRVTGAADTPQTLTKDADSVYEDAALSVGITICRVINEGGDNRSMLYCGNELGTNLCRATSDDAGLTWTKTHSSILASVNMGWVLNYQLIGGEYYIWGAYDIKIFSGISRKIGCWKTSDWTNFKFLGTQIITRDGSEYGIGGTFDYYTKPNGNYFILHTVYRNQIHTAANSGEEFNGICVAELDRSDLPLAGTCNFAYPSYVSRHWSCSPNSYSGLTMTERVAGDACTINSTPAWTAISAYANRTLDMQAFSGSQTLTCPGVSINTNVLAVKLRVSLTLTGTHTLFKIGSDIWVTLESGNLRVRLSSDGSSYQKDYISTADISKPSGLPYIDNHIWVGFTFNNGTLKLYNDFNEFSTTKTVDNALTNINNSGSSVLIGDSATLGIRSVSLLSGQTDAQFIALEI